MVDRRALPEMPADCRTMLWRAYVLVSCSLLHAVALRAVGLGGRITVISGQGKKATRLRRVCKASSLGCFVEF